MTALPRHLISQNDWARMRTALLHTEEVTISRSGGGLSVEVWTRKASGVWPVAAVVGVKVEGRGVITRQYFESVEAARAALEEWTV